jgi:hypothetical protein
MVFGFELFKPFVQGSAITQRWLSSPVNFSRATPLPGFILTVAVSANLPDFDAMR